MSSSVSHWPAVYADLRRLATRLLTAERPDHTLQPTALVHEVYLRLADQPVDRWADPAHFFRAAAEAMRRTLVDHARARGRAKRGGGTRPLPLTEAADLAALMDADDRVDPDDVLRLDAAVTRLIAQSPEAGEVVRLRFYAGLSAEQTATALGTSVSSVRRQWLYARAWLYRQLAGDARPPTN